MTSGLEGDGNSFMPDKAIERDDVINLIWTRNGKDESCFAPSVITSQGKNKEAVAWAYATGILKGDDGYNLRLDESLTRAEAAVLIIRAREVTSGDRKYNFTDVIRPEILKAVFEGARIFETGYMQKSLLLLHSFGYQLLRQPYFQHALILILYPSSPCQPQKAKQHLVQADIFEKRHNRRFSEVSNSI
jgi:hypothetical protein